ncbi:hypothetical protein OAB94_02350 [Flavobacteriaceae bacterium]|nr:hypothetical protein [Flavobacteriaceae bacterium]
MKNRFLLLLAFLTTSFSFSQYRISTEGISKTFTIQDLSNVNDFGESFPRDKVFSDKVAANLVSVKIEGVTQYPRFLVEYPGISYTEFRDGNDSDATFASAEAVRAWFRDNTGFKTASGGSGASGDFLKKVIVNQDNVATTLGGVIDSSKEYFIDGIIDMGTTQITVPATGMTLKGYSFDISGLTSSANNYTMFISASVGGDGNGSGNLLGQDYFIEVTGTNSKVYELYDDTGFNAFEFVRINYIDCISLGDIFNYRQGLEDGTGRFGGSPSLTLHGLWRGGYRITTSIVRSMSDTTTEPLFKEGTAFQMNSRFLTDINCDLGDLQPFTNFIPANFPNESTIQFKGVIMTRGGVSDSDDANITPNLSESNLACDWDNNIGMNNTFIGGTLTNTVEAETDIVAAGVGVDMEGTWTASDLQHFDNPASNELRHIGSDPKDFRINFSFVVDGGSNDVIAIELVKVDGFANATLEFTQKRVINNLQGNRDVAYFTGSFNIRMSKNDFVVWQVTNITDTTDITLELDSAWSIEER